MFNKKNKLKNVDAVYMILVLDHHLLLKNMVLARLNHHCYKYYKFAVMYFNLI